MRIREANKIQKKKKKKKKTQKRNNINNNNDTKEGRCLGFWLRSSVGNWKPNSHI